METLSAHAIVANAKGYGLSQTLYKAYGLRTKIPWPQLIRCATIYTSVGSAPVGGPIVASNKDKSAQLANDIHRIYSNAETLDDSTTDRSELDALARVQLGENYEQGMIAAVAVSQRRWREKQQHLVNQLLHKELTPDVYRQLNRIAISEMAEECVRYLGRDGFERLFGVSVKDAPDILIPPTS